MKLIVDKEGYEALQDLISAYLGEFRINGLAITNKVLQSAFDLEAYEAKAKEESEKSDDQLLQQIEDTANLNRANLKEIEILESAVSSLEGANRIYELAMAELRNASPITTDIALRRARERYSKEG